MSNSITAERLIKKGNLALKKGDAHGAAQFYQRAFESNANNHLALIGYAQAMMKLSNPGEALRAGAAAVQIAPKSGKAFQVAASAAMAMRDWAQLMNICEAWRGIDSRDPEAIRWLAHAYFELGSAEKARDVFHDLVKANPKSADHLVTYARLCLGAFDYVGAEVALEKAHTLSSPTAESLYALARVKMFLGALDEAETLSFDAIKKNPKFALPFAQYTTLRGGRVDDETRQQMIRLADDAGQHPEHRASMYFAIGDVFHRDRDYAQALGAYDAGNALSESIISKEGISYQPTTFEQQRQREQRAFRSLPSGHAFADAPIRPIFVVGMPRSGTTLTESILAAHPDVVGAGELHTFPAIHNNVLQWCDSNGGKPVSEAPRQQLQAWRAQYFAGLPKVSDERFVVDKQPLNFRGAGLIKALFPEAIIIHIRRNPLDTGLSIYRNDFAKAWPYATKMESIAHFYGEYARIVHFWEASLGAAFPLIQYEQLIADFEVQAKRLVSLCDLDWRTECLEFHKVQRPVATFSTTQVREPIRQQVTHVIDQYGDTLLKPMIDGLTKAGVDMETGALTAEALKSGAV